MELRKNDPGREKIKEENAFLKMKLMLEHGAQFSGERNPDLPPELENFFLNHIVEFEELVSRQPLVTVFQAIGRPDHFLPATQIADADIHDAWNELRLHLNRHGIDLNACSPAVTERELYRFATEELFSHEMVDLDLPGWRCNFIYDEFHPDPAFEAITQAREGGMNAIFCKEPIQDGNAFEKENLRLNLYHTLSRETFLKIINRFKDSFEDVILTSLSRLEATVNGNESLVTGCYRARGVLPGERIQFRGDCRIALRKDENEHWKIRGIEVSGIEF